MRTRKKSVFGHFSRGASPAKIDFNPQITKPHEDVFLTISLRQSRGLQGGK